MATRFVDSAQRAPLTSENKQKLKRNSMLHSSYPVPLFLLLLFTTLEMKLGFVYITYAVWFTLSALG